jgi:hypothetical protein
MRICGAEVGLFPINTKPRSQSELPYDRKPLPYFENMRSQATKIVEIYKKNSDLINHLSKKKAVMYNIMMHGHAEIIHDGPQLGQKLIKSIYC